jgi:hypothetical protein
MSSRIVLAVFATMFVGGCAVYGTELTSIPTASPQLTAVYECRTSSIHDAPPSGARLCVSLPTVKMDVKAHNAEQVAGAIGPLPLIPFFPQRRPSAAPLEIDLAFEPVEPYSFQPWQVSLQTDQGETVRVSGVRTNVRDRTGAHTVAIDPRDTGARTLEAHAWSRFSLTFEKHIAPEQSFALTVHLIAPDGADVQVPIRFKKGKVSYLETSP